MQVAIQELEACQEPWAPPGLAAGLHLLKLSLKCFAMIKQGGRVWKTKGRGVGISAASVITPNLQIQPLVPTHTYT